ncbi:MAG: hypothetical protein HYV39_01935 [Candidatus Levybacteria bacterium]|nr:hypothetical protein [Candidatus Levybacteria bacterium]
MIPEVEKRYPDQFESVLRELPYPDRIATFLENHFRAEFPILTDQELREVIGKQVLEAIQVFATSKNARGDDRRVFLDMPFGEQAEAVGLLHSHVQPDLQEKARTVREVGDDQSLLGLLEGVAVANQTIFEIMHTIPESFSIEKDNEGYRRVIVPRVLSEEEQKQLEEWRELENLANQTLNISLMPLLFPNEIAWFNRRYALGGPDYYKNRPGHLRQKSTNCQHRVFAIELICLKLLKFSIPNTSSKT